MFFGSDKKAVEHKGLIGYWEYQSVLEVRKTTRERYNHIDDWCRASILIDLRVAPELLIRN